MLGFAPFTFQDEKVLFRTYAVYELLRRVAIGSALCAASFSQELPRGVVLDHVPTVANSTQSYALYLPAAYSRDHSWPVLYCLDPGARGRIPVDRFAAAAERLGFIVIGSNNSRNGPIEPVREAIQAMVLDTRSRLAIDPSRVYVAGFSGGSRLALRWAEGGAIRGVVACGAAFGPDGLPDKVGFLIYAAAGVDDFNYHELHEMSIASVEARREAPIRGVRGRTRVAARDSGRRGSRVFSRARAGTATPRFRRTNGSSSSAMTISATR